MRCWRYQVLQQQLVLVSCRQPSQLVRRQHAAADVQSALQGLPGRVCARSLCCSRHKLAAGREQLDLGARVVGCSISVMGSVATVCLVGLLVVAAM
jgi:hypothetical protein